MFSYLQFMMANPLTGDNSDSALTIGLVAGGICLLAALLLLVIPKLLRKSEANEDETQVEEINEDE